VVGGGAGLSLLLTGIPCVYFLKPEWLIPVYKTMGWQNPVQRTVKILVAEFEGPEPQNYRFTDYLLNEIKEKTVDYKDVLVVPLGKAITEQEGKDVARRVGKEKKADIVIWGWYGKTKDKVPLSVHFELLSKPNELPELGAQVQGKVRSLSVATLESFDMQVDVAQEITYLSLVTLGMSRYSAKDWDGAIVRLSAALESVKPLPKVLDPAAVYFFRAIAYYHKGEKDREIVGYNQALKLNPKFAKAYTNRCLVYIEKGEYDRALTDCNQALKLDPKYAKTYNNRCWAYIGKGEYDRALTDCTQALKLDPKYAEAYNNRGLAYYYKVEYDRALTDYNQALKLNPNLPKLTTIGALLTTIKASTTRRLPTTIKSSNSIPNLPKLTTIGALLTTIKASTTGRSQTTIKPSQTTIKPSNSIPTMLMLTSVGAFLTTRRASTTGRSQTTIKPSNSIPTMLMLTSVGALLTRGRASTTGRS
jgi:tetratricopeptide (TPR) repeat protein